MRNLDSVLRGAFDNLDSLHNTMLGHRLRTPRASRNAQVFKDL
jgi:hypothetical protein